MTLPPFWRDLRRGGGARTGGDLIAGTITAALLIPQALAYALLAGLPLQVGLYASILPPIIYALLGSSRTLAVGPVAVAAVMVGAALAGYAGDDPERLLQGAILLAAFGGLLMFVMGLLRMGWLTHFISHPVLSGFVTGAAILIIATQLVTLAGVSVERGSGFRGHVMAMVWQLPQWHLPSLLLGIVSIALLLLGRSPLRRLLLLLGVGAAVSQQLSRLAPLALVVAATGWAATTDAATRWGIAVVGTVPGGLPVFPLTGMFAGQWWSLLPSAALIALIGYVESVSVARTLALRRRESVSPDQELLALGSANLAAAASSSMPVAGGFSRSVVNFDAGAQTQLASIVTALWVLLVALLLGGMLSTLPLAVLAAVILVAVWQLIELRALRRTWRYDRGDGSAQFITLAGVLLLGIEAGLILGVVTAIASFVYRTSRPHIAVVGRVAGTEHYRNLRRHDVETWPQLMLIRIDESLYFANAPRIEAELLKSLHGQDDLQHLVLILSGVNSVDATGAEMLERLHEELARLGVSLHLAEIKGPVEDQLRRGTLLQQLGSERVHLSTQQAVNALQWEA